MSDDKTGSRSTCGAGMDGECYADGCVQRRDGRAGAFRAVLPAPDRQPVDRTP